MKRTLSFMVMALALLLTQCRKPEVKFLSPVAPEGTTVSMTVTAGPGSKTDISETGAITWSTGDKLYVGDGAKYIGCLTLVSGQNTPTGTFSGDVTLTGISEGTQQTFHFFYLGSNPPAVTSGASSVEVSFAEQTGLRENLGSCHVGYGSAKGTVKDGVVTGINVTLVSKVAIAYFSFKEAAGKGAYVGALTLSGEQIYNKMTVRFDANDFSFSGTPGDISLTNTTTEKKYVMLVPTGGTGDVALSFDGGGKTGSATIEGGIQSNKFYGKTGAIPVNLTAPAPTHEYVDLGLPSGLLWATCNLGAEHPYDYGDYYAWGEIEPYYADGHSQDEECSTWRSMTTGAGNTVITNGYAWRTYSQGGLSSFAEWTTPPYDETTKVLKSGYDAAHANWGEPWRMPTGGADGEWQELASNTYMKWVYDYAGTGVAGFIVYKVKDAADKGLFTVDYDDNPEAPAWVTYNQEWEEADLKGDYSLSDVHLFLPAAGYRDGAGLSRAGSVGYYWSSSLLSSDPVVAYYMDFGSGGVLPLYNFRCSGYSVRPVRPAL